MKEITLITIEDHSMFKDGLKNMIKSESSIRMVGEADSVMSGKELIRKTNPEIILLDLTLDNESGMDILSWAKKSSIQSKVLILSMHNKPVLFKKVLQAGADGYVLKQSPFRILHDAILQIANGDRYIDPALSDCVYSCIVDDDGIGSIDSSFNRLTKREQEIFQLLVEGETPSTIAKKLYISKKTAENHRFNIMTKLEKCNTNELIRYGEDIGLI
jgi:DNA-binding NarL/FixJ family response regulator